MILRHREHICGDASSFDAVNLLSRAWLLSCGYTFRVPLWTTSTMVHLALNSRESLHSSWSVFIYDIGLTIYFPTEVLLIVVLQFVQHLFSGWECNTFMLVNINLLSLVSHLNTITLTNVWFLNHTKSFAFTDYFSEWAKLYMQHVVDI